MSTFMALLIKSGDFRAKPIAAIAPAWKSLSWLVKSGFVGRIVEVSIASWMVSYTHRSQNCSRHMNIAGDTAAEYRTSVKNPTVSGPDMDTPWIGERLENGMNALQGGKRGFAGMRLRR
jgi:hypothetical protein